MFTLQTLQVFYARDVLANANYIIVLTLLSVAGMFVTGPVIPKLVDAFGKKSAYIGSCVVAVASGVGIALSPASLPWLAFVFFSGYGLGLSVAQALMWTLEADTVEYGEWETGARTEGSNYALLSFARKVGQGIGGGVRPPDEDRAVHGEVRGCPAERLVQARGDDLQGGRGQPVGARGLEPAAGDRLSEGVHQPRGPRRVPDMHDVQVNAAVLRLRGGAAQRLQARQRPVHADEHPAVSSLEHGSQRLRYVPAGLDGQRRAIALRCRRGPGAGYARRALGLPLF